MHDVVPLGIIEETGRSITIGSLSEIAMTVGSEQLKVHNATAITFVLIKGKLIFLKSSAEPNDYSDINEFKSRVAGWVKAILDLNN